MKGVDVPIIVRLSGTTKHGDHVEAAVMTYISPDTDNFYLSRESMIQLGIIDRDFPQLGAAQQSHTHNPGPLAHNPGMLAEVAETNMIYADCGCLKREMPPEKHAKLPFECTIENVDKMKTWLLTQYASSTFNKCPHQKLPAMEGPLFRSMSIQMQLPYH